MTTLPAAVVLGTTGRLGQAVTERLVGHGFRVIRATRNPEADAELRGIDVLDDRWQRPECWGHAMAAVGSDPGDVTAVINLVAGRQRSAMESSQTGVAAIRAMMALAAACSRSGATVRSLHVGTVAEFCRGRLSPYAAGKKTARAEAFAQRVTVIMTVGVVPRPPRDPRDRALRRLAAVLPELAGVPIAISAPEEVGDALALLATADWAKILPCRRTTDVTLTGTPQPLGRILGIRSSPRWYSGGLLTLLAHFPVPKGGAVARAKNLAKISDPGSDCPNHYVTLPPRDAVLVKGWQQAAGWYLVISPAVAARRLWLISAGIPHDAGIIT